jgi:hypothetical protein
MSEDDLVDIGEEKWEVGIMSPFWSGLKYMVSSSAESGYIAATRPSTEVLQLLTLSGLMAGVYVTSLDPVTYS